jgi:alpha-glucosidase
VREAIELRYALMPYLYTQMWRASRDNEPAVRPLFYDFPDDGAIHAVEDAFMLGPHLLVAPVLEEGARQRRVTLPSHPGGWFDWHEGRHFDGGELAVVEAPLGRLPLFVRAGAIVPVGEPTGLSAVRELLAFGAGQQGQGELYEDDGETSAWRAGGGSITSFAMADGVLTWRSEGLNAPSFASMPLKKIERRG